MWAGSLHRPPHHVSGPRGRLWDRFCLLLLCLVHLLQLFPGQDKSKLTTRVPVCEFLPSPAFLLLVFRCWICLWPWSWITLSTWLETRPSWVPITWTSLFAYGGSMIVLHGEIYFFFYFLLLLLINPQVLWLPSRGLQRPGNVDAPFHGTKLSGLALPGESQIQDSIWSRLFLQ